MFAFARGLFRRHARCVFPCARCVFPCARRDLPLRGMFAAAHGMFAAAQKGYPVSKISKLLGYPRGHGRFLDHVLDAADGRPIQQDGEEHLSRLVATFTGGGEEEGVVQEAERTGKGRGDGGSTASTGARRTRPGPSGPPSSSTWPRSPHPPRRPPALAMLPSSTTTPRTAYRGARRVRPSPTHTLASRRRAPRRPGGQTRP